MPLQRHLRLVTEAHAASVRIAFATRDRRRVDQHFGAARSFAIYQIGPDHARQVSIAEFGRQDRDGNEDKLLVKLQVLRGCAAVYCQAAGASAIRQLLAMGVQPVKVAEGSEIEMLIRALQAELRDAPSGWLARALTRTAPAPVDDRFDAMAAEGWDC